MKQEEFNEWFRQRTKQLALDTIRALSSLKYDDAGMVLKKQLIRSITSVAANFRAVCRSRSEKERYAKLCFVVEEADESIFWLEMLEEAGLLSGQSGAPLRKEADEIVKTMSAFRKKLQDSITKNVHNRDRADH